MTRSRVVEELSDEKAELIRAAEARGYRVTGKQIDRYRVERVLPPAGTQGRGKSGGVARPSAPGTIEQLIALRTILKEDRSFDRAAVRLWLDRYDVPLERVREALHKTVVSPIQRLVDLSDDELERTVLDLEFKLADRRSVSKRVKSLARSGELASVMRGMLQFIRPGEPQLTDAELSKFSDGFEKIAALDKAREGLAEIKVGAWIDDDIATPMRRLLEVAPQLRAVAEASDEDLLAARDDYNGLAFIQQWANLIQQHFGEDALGLRLLTHDFYGNEVRTGDPMGLAGVMFLTKTYPEVRHNLRKISAVIQDGFKQIAEAQRQTQANS